MRMRKERMRKRRQTHFPPSGDLPDGSMRLRMIRVQHLQVVGCERLKIALVEADHEAEAAETRTEVKMAHVTV